MRLSPPLPVRLETIGPWQAYVAPLAAAAGLRHDPRAEVVLHVTDLPDDCAPRGPVGRRLPAAPDGGGRAGRRTGRTVRGPRPHRLPALRPGLVRRPGAPGPTGRDAARPRPGRGRRAARAGAGLGRPRRRHLARRRHPVDVVGHGHRRRRPRARGPVAGSVTRTAAARGARRSEPDRLPPLAVELALDGRAGGCGSTPRSRSAGGRSRPTSSRSGSRPRSPAARRSRTSSAARSRRRGYSRRASPKCRQPARSGWIVPAVALHHPRSGRGWS